jgi:cell division protein FtsZ
MVDTERELDADLVARLLVVGVGGAGGNAIRAMLRAQPRGVEFLAINTDAQALARTGATSRLRIGERLTRGLGAGGNPEVGLRAAEESHDAIRTALAGTDMVFITAGMGGGTGTGASPAVAVAAREVGALVVGIVTTPFVFEGEPRRLAAERGLAALREQVDTIIIVPNERLLRLAGTSTRLGDAYALADDVLRQGVESISTLITTPGHINLDFADVRAVMADAGSAHMGTGEGSGERRAAAALEAALTNPLLELDITGARAVLVNVTGGPDLTVREIGETMERLRQRLHPSANILFGTVDDPAYEGRVRITLVAAGFEPAVTHAGRPALGYQAREPHISHEPRVSPVTAPRLPAPETRAARAPSDDADLRALAGAAYPSGNATRMPATPPIDPIRVVRRQDEASGTATYGDDDGLEPVWPAAGVTRPAPPPAAVPVPVPQRAPVAPSLADELDEPRAGQARLRPAGQEDARRAGHGGIELPGFLRPRR